MKKHRDPITRYLIRFNEFFKQVNCKLLVCLGLFGFFWVCLGLFEHHVN